MKKYIIILCLLSLAIKINAQESQTVYNFLNIPVSAHGAALGGENISIIEDDASLALSNPALLSSVSSKTVSLGYMNYMSGTSVFTGNYTHVLSEKATIGGAVHYLNYGQMKERDHYGNELGTFTPSDLAFEALFSYTLAKDLVGGIGAKFIYSKIGDYSSTAAAIDLGLNYYNPDWDFSASIVARNLGGQLSSYNDEHESMPVNLSVGFSQRLRHTPLRLSLTFQDLTHWDYNFFQHICLGLDVIIIPQVYIAGGYNFRRPHYMSVTSLPDGESSSHGAGWTVGGGLTLERFKLHFSYGKYHMASHSFMFNIAYTL